MKIKNKEKLPLQCRVLVNGKLISPSHYTVDFTKVSDDFVEESYFAVVSLTFDKK